MSILKFISLVDIYIYKIQEQVRNLLWYDENCFNMKIMKMKVKVCLENDLHADKTQNSAHI